MRSFRHKPGPEDTVLFKFPSWCECGHHMLLHKDKLGPCSMCIGKRETCEAFSLGERNARTAETAGD